MTKNLRFALAFRLCALFFAAAGIMAQSGMFSGKLNLGTFMFYTLQSNLLAVILFALLAIRTAKSLREGPQGNAGWYPRFEMVCVVNLLVTLIVFWSLLAGFLSASYLWSFENIAVHTVTPLLCLVDYLLFTKARHLKYRDVYYTCIFPLFYVAFTSIAGLAGYTYHYTATFDSIFDAAPLYIEPVRFPYFFLDFDRIGLMALVYIAGISVFIILLGHGMYLVDRKVRKDALL